MEIRDKIIEYIRRNRVSTTEVADCLGKTGALEQVVPVNRGHFRVGVIRWIYAYNESNWEVHEQIREAQPGDIIYIEVFQCNDRAAFGELVSKFLLLYKQCQAIVTNGKVRDAHRLIKENYPIWSSGFTPLGCFNEKNSEEFNPAVKAERMQKLDGGVMVCDDSGCVIIPKDKLTMDF